MFLEREEPVVGRNNPSTDDLEISPSNVESTHVQPKDDILE